MQMKRFSKEPTKKNGPYGFRVRAYASSGVPDHYEVSFSNVSFTGGYNQSWSTWMAPLYCRDNATLNLTNVILTDECSTALEFDATDSFMDSENGTYATLNLNGVTIGESAKINISGNANVSAKVYINYENCTNISDSSFTYTNCDGTTIYLNGVEFVQ